jgi:hypothetical protein
MNAEATSMKLVLDEDHLTLLREWASVAQVRLLISSTELDSISAKRLESVANEKRSTQFAFDVIYENSKLDAQLLTPIRESIEKCGGRLRRVEDCAANALISDTSACVSSFTFMSGNSESETRAREIGVVLDGVAVSNRIFAALSVSG